jgi:hypothetical protein
MAKSRACQCQLPPPTRRNPQKENDQDAGGSGELEAAQAAIAEARGIFAS